MAACIVNRTRLPALMKIGQIIMLIIVIFIAQLRTYIIFEYKNDVALFYGIVIGYMIVYLILIVCYLIGETGTQRSKFELLLNVVGFILFFSLSIKMVVNGYNSHHKYYPEFKRDTIVVGVFMLLISACQLVDAFFNFRSSGD